MNASPMWAMKREQLIVKPSGDFASVLQTTSIFGATGKKCQRF